MIFLIMIFNLSFKFFTTGISILEIQFFRQADISPIIEQLRIDSCKICAKNMSEGDKENLSFFFRTVNPTSRLNFDRPLIYISSRSQLNFLCDTLR
jgi:hypothetical protein